MTKWLSKDWYRYLFATKNPYISWVTVVKCRIQGHPKGAIWFNVYGYEPDMTCTTCGDNLG